MVQNSRKCLRDIVCGTDYIVAKSQTKYNKELGKQRSLKNAVFDGAENAVLYANKYQIGRNRGLKFPIGIEYT